MILVDSSLWIMTGPDGVRIEDFVARDFVVTCLPVIQEVLQGVRHEAAWRRAEKTFFAMTVLESPMSDEVFVEAAELYRTGRRMGFTIRSAFDCLIAACAIRNRVPLYHCDRDFDAISRFSPLMARNVMQ
jgi:predicted nucleic acid-binding protein